MSLSCFVSYLLLMPYLKNLCRLRIFAYIFEVPDLYFSPIVLILYTLTRLYGILNKLYQLHVRKSAVMKELVESLILDGTWKGLSYRLAGERAFTNTVSHTFTLYVYRQHEAWTKGKSAHFAFVSIVLWCDTVNPLGRRGRRAGRNSVCILTRSDPAAADSEKYFSFCFNAEIHEKNLHVCCF